MATKQGMCKNCGSLIVYDDRDDKCECIFCHCVFPSAEAAEIMENPGNYTFPNETYEASTDSSHHYVSPVYPDVVEKAVAREKVSKERNSDKSGTGVTASEFELSPNDVKAPKNLVIGLIVGSVLVIGIVLGISWPMYLSRTSLKEDIVANIDSVFDGVAEVDTSINEDGFAAGYNIYGQTCQNIKVAADEDIDDAQAQQLYANYCDVRSSAGNISDSSGVKMEIYTPSGIYTVSSDGAVFDNGSEE